MLWEEMKENSLPFHSAWLNQILSPIFSHPINRSVNRYIATGYSLLRVRDILNISSSSIYLFHLLQVANMACLL